MTLALVEVFPGVLGSPGNPPLDVAVVAPGATDERKRRLLLEDGCEGL